MTAPATTKRDRVIRLLETYRELFGTRGNGNGDPDNPLLTPAEYKHYAELERCIDLMRQHRPKQYGHLRGWYFDSQTALKDVPVRRKATKGKHVTAIERRRVFVPAGWVRAHQVDLAVDWLTATMRHAELPKVVLELVA